jgi:hypothetical protein
MTGSLSPRATSAVAVLGVLLVTAYAGITAWAATSASYEVWSALVFVPVLLLAMVPLLVRAGRRDPDPRFLKLLCWAFALKMLATVARYLMAFVLYGGASDAKLYDSEGERLAIEYRDGNFGAEIGKGFVGTGFIRVLTGTIYAITGSSIYIAYVVFACFGFWGLYFLYRAFRVALPGGDAHRYALLTLFLPSMLFWPSSLGKEAFMMLGIGLTAYGAALVLSGYRRWPGPLLLGLLLTSAVRPHVTAALFLALGIAFVLRRRPRPATALTPLTFVVSVAALAAGALFVVQQAASFLNVEETSVEGFESAINATSERTDDAGSSFDPTGVNGVTDLPVAAFSVLFRPMVVEASNPQMMLAALEGTLLLVLVALSWRSLATVPGRLRRQPYLIFCLVYVLIFVFAFSNFSNFGILTRQRVQVLPFVLVFLALRTPHPYEAVASGRRSEPAREGAPT